MGCALASVKRPRDPVLIILPTCCLIEAVLLLSDLNWISRLDLRLIATDFGAFWPGLLFGESSLFFGQAVTMFASYGLLHGGPLHLAVNMLTLTFLTDPVLNRVGAKGFFLIYGIGTVAAAVGFALLSGSGAPMVGASGALFGLVGAILIWEYYDLKHEGVSRAPVIRVLAMITGLNVVLWYLSSGSLAWEAHLGGAIGGALTGLWIGKTGSAT